MSSLLLKHGIDTKNKTIRLIGDIDDAALDKVLGGLSELGHEDVTILLSTAGGCPYDAYGIYDALRQFAGHVKIICIGKVFSAGTIIMQAGDERLMTENAELLIHFGAAYAEDAATAKQHAKMDKKIISMLVDAVGGKRTRKTIARWFEKESYFSSDKALDAGLIDRIIENV